MKAAFDTFTKDNGGLLVEQVTAITFTKPGQALLAEYSERVKGLKLATVK